MNLIFYLPNRSNRYTVPSEVLFGVYAPDELLHIARYTEPFALLVAQLAYEGEGGPELAYRFERFGK